MFPYKGAAEKMVSFQTSDVVDEEIVIFDDVISAYGVDSSRSVNNRGRGRRGLRITTAVAADTSANTTNDDNKDDEKKKAIHRQTERQRRHEMSTLHDSLRSVIPADYIKGKRSVSDHLAEAVNYIKDLEKSLKELGDKRDGLKASMDSTTTKRKHDDGAGGSSQSAPCPGTVVIIPGQLAGGLDIEISVGYGDEGFALSTALDVILEEGLSIASNTSMKVDAKMVHNIICEGNDISSVVLDGLLQRLIGLVC